MAAELSSIRQCESGGNYSYNDGQFYGAYNFDLSTWHAAGGT
ncbi:MAG: transglycosylase, partial [Phycisphaeraceae bacterium]|nr:transglycosylase [Phycisphaeraceae bacterium]